MDVLRPLRITPAPVCYAVYTKRDAVSLALSQNRKLEQVLIGRVICLYLCDIVAHRVSILIGNATMLSVCNVELHVTAM